MLDVVRGAGYISVWFWGAERGAVGVPKVQLAVPMKSDVGAVNGLQLEIVWEPTREVQRERSESCGTADSG